MGRARDARRWCAAALTSLACWIAAGGVAAQQAPDRLAFVVGNGSYEWRAENQPVEGSRLNLLTPRNDALAYVDALEGLGWQIINEAIVDRSARALLDDLAAAATQITAGSEVVFIFNGHGFSDNNVNYLVGVPESGERYHTPGDMQAGSVSLDKVIQTLSEGDPRRIILIINACGDEPLVGGTSRRPARPDFDDLKPEILVLYSSSPRGIAYDIIDNAERLEARSADADPVYSLFSRNFLGQIAEERPLLSIFADVRITVERQSSYAATDRNLPLRSWRQIPHVLYDSIDGRFQLTTAEAGEEGDTGPTGLDWRADARLCRVDEDARRAALAAREQGQIGLGPEGEAVRACILEAALGDLGVAKVGYDAEANSVIVSQTNTASSFRSGDRIALVTVVRDGQPRKRFTFTSLEVFNDMLARSYFSPGSKFAFAWRRNDGTLPASGFELRSF